MVPFQNNPTATVPGLETIRGMSVFEPDTQIKAGLVTVRRERECGWFNMIQGLSPPNFLPEERANYCGWGHIEWKGVLHCDKEHWPYWGKYNSEPKCEAEDSIVMVPCAYMDGVSQQHAAYTTRHFFNLEHYMFHPQPCANAKGKVITFDKLVVTANVYPASAGHFLPAVLPRILFVSQALPSDVTILILARGKVNSQGTIDTPDGVIQRYLEPLLSMGLIRRNQIVYAPKDQNVAYYAKELYMPINSHFEHILVHAKVHNALRKAFLSAAAKAGKPCPRAYKTKDIILVIHRGNSRKLVNEPEVIQSLKGLVAGDPKMSQFFTNGLTVQTWVPSKEGIVNDIDLFDRAALIIAPHGAGLSNMMFASVGVPVVELCYQSKKPMQCPHMVITHT